MTAWLSLLRRPPSSDCGAWFAGLAGHLLNGVQLMVGDTPHRLVEVEGYYTSADHDDPFTHRDPLQRESARWYFHRTAGVYRGGSFKGLDITIGDGTATGGILIRSIAGADGTIIDGPSLTVDHLLATTHHATIAELDQAIAGRAIADTTSPLALVESHPPRTDKVWQTARIGLAMKKAAARRDGPDYIGRPYRYLTEPRGVRKGKLHLVLALHAAGESPERIAEITGSPRAATQRYIADYEAGRQLTSFAPYLGKNLTPAELCRMFGTCAAK